MWAQSLSLRGAKEKNLCLIGTRSLVLVLVGSDSSVGAISNYNNKIN
jgi:hypothetical protein